MQDRHAPRDEIKRDLDAMAAKVNALEVAASDEWQRGVAKVLRALVSGQAHSLDEFGHHRKAMDLLLLEIFKARDGASGASGGGSGGGPAPQGAGPAPQPPAAG